MRLHPVARFGPGFRSRRRLKVAGLVIAASLLVWGPGLRAEEIRFAFYNLKNYVLMDRGGKANAPKPQKEVEALIDVIKAVEPDILGVCELGDRSMFEDLERRLHDAGLAFEHSEYLEESPDIRRLALFSRLPFASRQSQTDVPYVLDGTRQKLRRGMLDVTVKATDGYALRLLGMHLKSKRPVPEGEALVRRHEAHLVRKRIDEILKADPSTNLLAYGDLNDTKNEPPVQEISGVRSAPNYMMDVWLTDDRGDRWTYFWKYADLYSRIDYIFVSRALKPEIIFDKSYIARPGNWYVASDHCLITTLIDTSRQEK